MNATTCSVLALAVPFGITGPWLDSHLHVLICHIFWFFIDSWNLKFIGFCFVVDSTETSNFQIVKIASSISRSRMCDGRTPSGMVMAYFYKALNGSGVLY